MIVALKREFETHTDFLQLGQRVTLDLGKDVVTWLRRRDTGSEEESIRYCDEAHNKQPNCNKWVDAVGDLKDVFHFFSRRDSQQIFKNMSLLRERK